LALDGFADWMTTAMHRLKARTGSAQAYIRRAKSGRECLVLSTSFT
jgi:hypothetical protein